MKEKTMIKQFVAKNKKISDNLTALFPNFFYHPWFGRDLRERIQQSIDILNPDCVIEVGGIDRPQLKKSDRFIYVGVDIEEREGCYTAYDKFLVQSIEENLPIKGQIIFSAAVLEHVPDNLSAIKSIFNSLEPNGMTHHYLPSKWHPYSLILRLITPKLQLKIIRYLRPWASETTGYPAYFDYCSPRAMRKLFQDVGFVEINTLPYYDANDYFSFFVPFFIIVKCYEHICRILGLELLASGFIISAKKP